MFSDHFSEVSSHRNFRNFGIIVVSDHFSEKNSVKRFCIRLATQQFTIQIPKLTKNCSNKLIFDFVFFFLRNSWQFSIQGISRWADEDFCRFGKRFSLILFSHYPYQFLFPLVYFISISKSIFYRLRSGCRQKNNYILDKRNWFNNPEPFCSYSNFNLSFDPFYEFWKLRFPCEIPPNLRCGNVESWNCRSTYVIMKNSLRKNERLRATHVFDIEYPLSSGSCRTCLEASFHHNFSSL